MVFLAGTEREDCSKWILCLRAKVWVSKTHAHAHAHTCCLPAIIRKIGQSGEMETKGRKPVVIGVLRGGRSNKLDVKEVGG